LELAPLVAGDFADLLVDDAERDEPLDFRDVDVERFLDGPHVDMTSSTVPTGCHPRP
jgi:hypothetical protein